MYKFLSSIFLFLLIVANQLAFAQDGSESGRPIEPSHVAKWNEVTNWEKHPRYEDHFWRRKVRIRVDLLDKINKPQNEASIKIYDENSQVYSSSKDKYDYIEGIISALLTGYANGYMLGYSPDSLDAEVEFGQFRALYNKYSAQGGEPAADESESEDDSDDDWDDDSGDDGSDTKSAQASGDVLATPENASNEFTDITKYYDIIEDRIFDKNKSDMYYEPEYIVLYMNRLGSSPIPIIAFRYEDVKDTVLNKCLWRNRFNDAEFKTLKEIIELRLFGSYVLQMSQYGSKTIDEADRLRLQMLEFEHNLWEF